MIALFISQITLLPSPQEAIEVEIKLNKLNLLEILKREGLSAEEEALQTISREAAGSVRDALSILDQVLVNCETKIENRTASPK